MVYHLRQPVDPGDSSFERLTGDICEFKLSHGGRHISASVFLVFRMCWQDAAQFQMFVDVSAPFDERQAFASIKEGLLETAWDRLADHYGIWDTQDETGPGHFPEQCLDEPVTQEGRGTPDWLAGSTLTTEQEADLLRELDEILKS